MTETAERPKVIRAIVSGFRKTHHFLGFTKGYAFIFWFIFRGALASFILARLQYLDIDGRFCPPVPAGDDSSGMAAACYWVVRFTRYKVGMIMHLSTSLPAMLIAVFQFIPATRQFVLYHGTAGYTTVTLAFIGNIDALILTEMAMGGDLPTRVIMGAISLATTITFGLAVYNIRKAQLEGHRVWMLRSWSYIGFIVTLPKYIGVTCAELHYIFFSDQRLGTGSFTKEALDSFEATYPDCAGLTSSEQRNVHVVVKGVMNPKDPGQSNAALMTTFAAAGWLAIMIHAAAVEAFIWLTPAETERLRKISYQRQLARKYKNPGSAGAVAQRLGDADEGSPPAQKDSGTDERCENESKV